jgi:hypothetical protein
MSSRPMIRVVLHHRADIAVESTDPRRPNGRTAQIRVPADMADNRRVTSRRPVLLWISAALIMGGCATTTDGTGRASSSLPRVTTTTSTESSTTNSTASGAAPTSSSPDQSTRPVVGPTLAQLLSKFAGTYSGHGRGLTITAAGKGTIAYRVYKWCSDDPTPPCDDMQGNNIIDGGQITFVLRSAFAAGTSTIAEGVLTSSTDPSIPQGQPVTARRSGYIVALSAVGTFCASNTPPQDWVCGA